MQISADASDTRVPGEAGDAQRVVCVGDAKSHYNGKVSYWARPPAPPDEPSTSWATFAAETDGIEPGAWDLTPPG